MTTTQEQKAPVSVKITPAQVIAQVGNTPIKNLLARAEKAEQGNILDSLTKSEKWAISVFNFLKGKHVERQVFVYRGNQESFNRGERKQSEADFIEQNSEITLIEMLEICEKSYELYTLKDVLKAHNETQTRKNNRIKGSYVRTQQAAMA
ncbi:hypothetical protein ACQ4M3_13385 [Leptolyngbya sp. AN03gr2]|uniref:hypothetical protein n=1 Tax=unclassified Leptolyngbya TaxID=2650499 RepID=UPI003D31D193